MSLRRKNAIRLRIVRQHSAELKQDGRPESGNEYTDGGRVWRAVAQLPARQRDITELVFCREVTIEEASNIMGVSVGTGRVHYDRAKKALAKTLADMQDSNR